MKLKDYIQENKPQIAERLKSTLLEKEAETKISLYEDALSRLQRFSTSGKMMRGILVLFSAEMFGKNPNTCLNIAAAIELTHSGLLIHDDIIDDDELRRGEKTIFAQYAEGEDKFYGQSMAICVADSAFYIGMELISKSEIDESSKVEVQRYFAQELQNVIAAEMEDFHFGATDSEPAKDQILEMYRLKSARYTFSLPFVIGAKIAQKDDQTIRQLEELGENLGIVFQIVDDTLGITGDSEVTGKPVGNDIKQNKKTLFRAILYDKANEEQKKTLNSLFGKKDITDTDVKIIVDLSSQLQVKEEIEETVNRLSDNASQILACLEVSSEYKEFLTELIEYNLNRTK